jgi:hypothetical protein
MLSRPVVVAGRHVVIEVAMTLTSSSDVSTPDDRSQLTESISVLSMWCSVLASRCRRNNGPDSDSTFAIVVDLLSDRKYILRDLSREHPSTCTGSRS